MSADIVQIQSGDNTLVCAFIGPMNAERCNQVQKQIEESIESSGLPVVFDMKEVEFAASSFLRIVLTVNKKVGRERFQVVNVDPKVKKVFKMSGIWDALKLEG
ncbi:STAS domain-containing protein [Rubellicoccus peritrichatus]|uniref:STAS domain-containing protein n=1 Tax=Rubellicoccus peritrichatus TaxID=3080537 RepID=A0AAQ3QTK0_9BACT|nr:STAS domain-containing protein [Puniceicoccus sp. CR14]WOO41401.1 STAS domain-containing protein [Puniceicoccus sp. CR14]